MRDYTKLKVFDLADAVAPAVYRLTARLPSDERFGLQSQIRRAAVSVPTNIVEGCSYQSPKDFLRFLRISHGSASETRYLLGLAVRLEFFARDEASPLISSYDEIVRAIAGLIRTISDDA